MPSTPLLSRGAPLVVTLAFVPVPSAGQAHVLEAADAIAFDQPFSLLDGARELSDGRLVVSDWLEERVDLIDFATGDRAPIGSLGAGPEEYRDDLDIERLERYELPFSR